MNNGEFYNSSEFNKTSEYKHFPAEMYIKPKEENKSGNEQSSLGKEITTLQNKGKEQKASDSSKTIIDKIFSSVKAVATTATVAVTAVVVTTTLVTNAPRVDLISLDYKDTYVEYEMEISELQDDLDYSIVVSTSNEEDIKIEINENGTYKNRIEGLKPSWEYTLAFVCHDTSLGDVTHFQVKFQTEKHVEQQPNPPPEPIPPPDNYTGTYTIGSIVADWQNREIIAPIEFENPNSQYYYIIRLYDENKNQLSSKKYTDSQSVTFPILDDVSKYSLALELYGVGEAQEALIESKNIANLDYTPPSVDISGATIIGFDEIQIDFNVQNLNTYSSISFAITHSNATVEDIIQLTSKDISNGSITIKMDSGNSLSVNPTAYIKYEGSDSVRTIEYPQYDKVFDETLYIEAVVGLYNNKTTFFPKGISNGATTLKIIDSSSPDTENIEYYFNQPFYLYYSVNDVITYTMYLTNDNGDKLSNEVTVTADTTNERPEIEYSMTYPNPSEFGVTYNEDGTINLYVLTNFESASEDIYYQVRIGDKRYISREKYLEVLNLEDKVYSLEYDVCQDINGVSYSIFNYPPSGTINEISIENYYTAVLEDENTINLQFNFGTIFVDLSSVRAVSISGEEIILTEDDFIYNSETNSYSTSIKFSQATEGAIIYMEANSSYGDLDVIEDYKGSITRSYEIMV